MPKADKQIITSQIIGEAEKRKYSLQNNQFKINKKRHNEFQLHRNELNIYVFF